MPAFNDITGDKIATKPINDKYATGWDAIWGNKKFVMPVELNEDEKKYVKALMAGDTEP